MKNRKVYKRGKATIIPKVVDVWADQDDSVASKTKKAPVEPPKESVVSLFWHNSNAP